MGAQQVVEVLSNQSNQSNQSYSEGIWRRDESRFLDRIPSITVWRLIRHQKRSLLVMSAVRSIRSRIGESGSGLSLPPPVKIRVKPSSIARL